MSGSCLCAFVKYVYNIAQLFFFKPHKILDSIFFGVSSVCTCTVIIECKYMSSKHIDNVRCMAILSNKYKLKCRGSHVHIEDGKGKIVISVTLIEKIYSRR